MYARQEGLVKSQSRSHMLQNMRAICPISGFDNEGDPKYQHLHQ